jgi:ornithine decarboxylase
MSLSDSWVKQISEQTTPAILVSKELIEHNISYFQSTLEFENHEIFYPIKVNHNPIVIDLMEKRGLGFEVGAISECEMLVNNGIHPSRIRYGNPIKAKESIQKAHQLGITCFGADSLNELEKIAVFATRSSVYIRVSVNNSGAEWALTQKFGCPIPLVQSLFEFGKKLGLNMFGLSFHVGWNNNHIETWHHVFTQISDLCYQLKYQNIQLNSINIGGGFPAHLGNQYEKLSHLSSEILPFLTQFREDFNFEVVAEPGSFLVANAGKMVVRVIERLKRDNRDWVYVDSGIFQGFSWIMGGLQYQIEAVCADSPIIPMVVCGPTCDTHDVFSYEVLLPSNLSVGDLLVISPAGAYISSSKNYNGFSFPNEVVY